MKEILSRSDFEGRNINRLMKYFMWTLLSYFVVKFLFRPIAVSNDYSGFIELFVFSYPNFCEAIVGTFVVSMILLLVREVLIKKHDKKIDLNVPQLYLIAVILSGIYVISQECNIHNLGGYNTYCSIDITFSIMGLITAFFLLRTIKPTIHIK